MRWEGRRESSNIEDRRGSGGGNFGGGKGTGVLGIIILLVGVGLWLVYRHFELLQNLKLS